MEVNRKQMLSGAVRDSRAPKRSEKALRSSRLLPQAVLDSVNFGIIVTDCAGLIRTFNAGACEMLGYRQEEAIDKVTPEIFHDWKEIEARAEELCRQRGQPGPRASNPGSNVL